MLGLLVSIKSGLFVKSSIFRCRRATGRVELIQVTGRERGIFSYLLPVIRDPRWLMACFTYPEGSEVSASAGLRSILMEC